VTQASHCRNIYTAIRAEGISSNEGLEMSIFPTKILLATDGSKDALLANETAVDIANSTNSELHVLTVGRGTGYLDRQLLPGSEGGSGYAARDYRSHYEEVLEKHKQEAQRILDKQVRMIEEAEGSIIEAHIRVGDRRDQEILRLAEEIGTGLIVMGSRGLGGVRRALMGSVSDSVVRHAHCPVLIVRR
jgi:nucleotide-binding universal stress UspA family protein